MALTIATNCFSCYACETVCPEGAIAVEGDTFVINPDLCSECSDLEVPRCMAICPGPDVIKQID